MKTSWFGDTSSPTWHCFTIGHSDHSIDKFIQRLLQFNVDTLVDVRSTPFSQYQPQFNKEQLKNEIESLQESNSEGFTKASEIKPSKKITYKYMGDTLGGRYDDPTLFFQNKVVDYNKVRKTQKFQRGLEELFKIISDGKTVALMCSEKDPFDCHRFLLVSHSLAQKNVNVDHILASGDTISNGDLERKLMQKYGNLPVEKLYERRNKDVGYTLSNESPNNRKILENQTLNV